MNYYIEIKGRSFGPFTREQIDEKIAAGWLTRESRISYDGQNWQKAGDAGELFPNAQRTNYSVPTNSNESVEQKNQTKQREWYISIDGKTGSGPYVADDIVAAFNSGKANLDSLVWREGEYARPIKKEPFFANLTSHSNEQTTFRSTSSDSSSNQADMNQRGGGSVPPPINQTPYPVQSQKKRNIFAISAVGGVALLLIVAGAFCFLFKNSFKSNGSLGNTGTNLLFLYDEKKANVTLAEALSEVAKDAIVRIDQVGIATPEGEEEPEIYYIIASSGTGTVVSVDSQGRLLILTNCHVVGNYYATKRYTEAVENSGINPHDCRLKVTTFYGDSVDTSDGRCELLAIHKSETTGHNIKEFFQGACKGTDLALIRTAPLPKVRPRFYISNRESPKLGERLVTIGHPGGREFSPSEGTNQGLRDGRIDLSLRSRDIRADIFVYTIPTNSGNSGGPVFDSKGRIIGVHTCGFKDEQNFNGGYPADEIFNVSHWDILVSDNVSELFDNIPRQ